MSIENILFNYVGKNLSYYFDYYVSATNVLYCGFAIYNLAVIFNNNINVLKSPYKPRVTRNVRP